MNNTAELRTFLLKQMVALANGDVTIGHAQAVAALAKQINSTLALDLAAHRALAKPKALEGLRLDK